MPKLVLYNTELRFETIVDNKAIVSVKRLGNFTERKNKRLYDGTENPLSIERFYKTSFICDFDMSWYPFDTQVCAMEFVVEKSSSDVVEMVLGNLDYSGPLELTQYFIKKTMFHQKVGDKKIVVTLVSVILGRRLLSIILTVFAPTLILNIVGYFAII